MMDMNKIERGKLSPQAIDLEEAVLGAIMLEGGVVKKISTLLPQESFYKDSHQTIYNAIVSLSNKHNPIDILTVCEQLRSTGELEAVGGAYYISELTNKVASAAHTEAHSFIILQAFMRREAIRTATEIMKMSYDDTVDVMEITAMLSASARNLINIIQSKKTTNYSQSLVHTIDKIHELSESRKEIIGLSSGFRAQDRMTSGRCAGELTILAARPGMGKTSFLIQEALNMLRKGYSVGIFSLEMTERELLNRMISNVSNVPLWKIRKPAYLTKKDLLDIDECKDKMADYKLKIDDSGIRTINEISNLSGIWSLEHGTQVIYVDYLQLVKGNKEKNGTRQQEIGTVSRGLKASAKDYNIPIIALAQIGRSAEKNANKKPGLSDLREAGDLENDADVVQFIFRPEYYGIETDSEGISTAGQAEIIIEKNRHGSVGSFPLVFEGDFCRFAEQGSDIDVNSHIEPNRDEPF